LSAPQPIGDAHDPALFYLKLALHFSGADAANKRFLNNGNERAFSPFKMLDNRGLEVAVASPRDLQVKAFRSRVESADARAVTLISAALATFMRLRTDMLVELRLDRGVVSATTCCARRQHLCSQADRQMPLAAQV
jgi:hypothetical protein